MWRLALAPFTVECAFYGSMAQSNVFTSTTIMIRFSFYFILIKFCRADAGCTLIHTPLSLSHKPLACLMSCTSATRVHISVLSLHDHSRCADDDKIADKNINRNGIFHSPQVQRRGYTYRQKRPSNCAVDRMDTPLVPISPSPVHTWLCWFDTSGTSAEMNLCRTPTNGPATAVPEFVYNFGRIPVWERKRWREWIKIWENE